MTDQYYTCEGSLLVPTDHNDASRWRERLVSGKRMTVVLGVVGQGSQDERYQLWGENHLEEKLFEVNLRHLKGYHVRGRTWHEVTASDNRRFVLSFDDTDRFVVFFKQLESVLISLKKLTPEGEKFPGPENEGTNNIVILRVDKVPPPKPPREFQNLSSPNATKTGDPPPIPAPRVGFSPRTDQEQTGLIESDTAGRKTSSDTDGKPTSTWHINIYDDISRNSPTDDFEGNGTYDNIADTEDDGRSPSEFLTRNVIKDSQNGTVTHLHNPKLVSSKPARGKVGFSPDTTDRFQFADEYYPSSSQPQKNKTKEVTDNDANTELGRRNQCLNPRPKPAPKYQHPVPNTNETTRLPVSDNRPTAFPETRKHVPPPPPPLPKPRNNVQDESGRGSMDGNWRCERCTLVNSPSAGKCFACDWKQRGSRDDRTNEIRQQQSTYVIPSAIFKLLTGANGWQCSICSARNRQEEGSCNTCSAWVCSHCTLHNDPVDWICVACSRSRLAYS